MSHHFNIIREPDAFCKPCGMYEVCKTPVMNGEGAEHPVWEFVGEAPGKTEDEQGYPFCGDAGKLTRETLEGIGYNLQKCRFTNVVRCRPPDNNLQKWPKAVEHCRPHILREIHATNPKVVVLFGNHAIKSILKKTGILTLHGEVFRAHGRHYVCCFHPAYLMRNDTPKIRHQFKEALKTAYRLGTGQSKTSSEELKVKVHIIRDTKMLQEYTDMLKKEKFLSTDIEGSTLNPFSRQRKPEVGVVGFGYSKDEAVCYPGHHRKGDYREKIHVSSGECMEAVKEILENEDTKFALHFGKYDYVYLAVLEKIWIGGKRKKHTPFLCTGLMSYCLNEKKGGHGLKDWAYKIGMAEYDLEKRQYQLSHKETDPERGGNMLDIPVDILYDYNGKDCIAGYRLYFKLRKRLEKDKLWDLPYMFPLLWHNWTAAQMEIHGLNIDADYNAQLRATFPKDIRKVEGKLRQYPEVVKLQRQRDMELMEELYEHVKAYKRKPPSVRKKVLELYEKNQEEINLNAPENRRELIFKIMKYKPVWETKKSKQPSVAREVLEIIHRTQKRHNHKVVSLMVERGELDSAYDKYIKPIPSWISLDGRTHSTYKPQGQRTGRVSSEDPNHENLPARGRLSKILKAQFCSSGEGWFIHRQDEKQMEMRLFADRAQDDKMIEEFNAGKDPHKMGAAAGFEVPEEKVTKEQRDAAKSAVSFGLLYGRHAPALAADFGKPTSWAVKFINRYFGKYDECKEYIEDRGEYIKKHKAVYSHFFRPRRLPEVDSENEGAAAAAIREGINSPIQGDCSDVTWIAGHRLQWLLHKYKMKSKVVIIVHDAVYTDTWHKELQDVSYELHKFMIDRKFIEKMTGWYCTVPWETDGELGTNLSNLVALERKTDEFIIPSDLSFKE
jgi:uracil-DNA glycosylase family 4